MTILETVPGVQLVTDNLRLVILAKPEELPAVCLVDLGDDTESEDNYGRSNRCTMKLGFVSVVEGTTELTARTELAAFEKKVMAVLYNNIFECAYVDWFGQTGKSHVNYPDIGPRIVRRGIEFEIKYIESVQNLIAMTL